MLRYISIFCFSCRGAGMKRPHISGVLWVVIIFVNAYLSFSGPAKTNDITSVCDGSLEECLNARHLDSEFPTIVASHLARMLAESNSEILITLNRDEASCPIRKARYKDCFSPPPVGSIPKEPCRNPYYRAC